MESDRDSKKNALTEVESLPFKEKILEIRHRMRGDVTHLTEGALNKTRVEASGDLSSMPIHMADLGTDAYEQEFSLDMVKAEEDTLGEIQAALERIEAGVYGACTSCGSKVKKARLNAIPFTPFCINCATEQEQH
ncbi:MAG: transcriptional regulator [Blastopirellula sp.]|nr:MAG: transcriptional regulator [Blastopirellula sp.]